MDNSTGHFFFFWFIRIIIMFIFIVKEKSLNVWKIVETFTHSSLFLFWQAEIGRVHSLRSSSSATKKSTRFTSTTNRIILQTRSRNDGKCDTVTIATTCLLHTYLYYKFFLLLFFCKNLIFLYLFTILFV